MAVGLEGSSVFPLTTLAPSRPVEVQHIPPRLQPYRVQASRLFQVQSLFQHDCRDSRLINGMVGGWVFWCVMWLAQQA
ncbi:hypothetical protein GB937_001211 [Aspergillus fischeri]|nr:hypothetical protein GB937_001211 [Aspergillus fischeri]